jgi:hypothetical protein
MDKEQIIDKGVVATAILTNGIEVIGLFFNIVFEDGYWRLIDEENRLIRIERPLRLLTGIILAPHENGLVPQPVANPAPMLSMGMNINEFSLDFSEFFIMMPANPGAEKMYLQLTSGIAMPNAQQASSILRS